MKEKRKQKEARSVHQIRGWAAMRGISYIEIAFRAYSIYSEERSEIEARFARRKTLDVSKETEKLPRRAGPYSFINLLSFNSSRW